MNNRRKKHNNVGIGGFSPAKQHQQDGEVAQLARREKVERWKPIKIKTFRTHEHTDDFGNPGVIYCTRDKDDNLFSEEYGYDTPRFIDYHTSVQFCSGATDSDLKNGIELFIKKFPGVPMEIQGCDDFKMRFAEIATKAGVEIANPELRDFVASLITVRLRKDLTPESDNWCKLMVPFHLGDKF